jgi:lactoylglutathione lyase
VREHQRRLKSQGLKLTNEVDESSPQDESVRLADSTGPASFMMVDPDGHPVFIDQHV